MNTENRYKDNDHIPSLPDMRAGRPDPKSGVPKTELDPDRLTPLREQLLQLALNRKASKIRGRK